MLGEVHLQVARAAVLAAAVLIIMVEVEPVLVLYIRDHHQTVLHQLDGEVMVQVMLLDLVLLLVVVEHLQMEHKILL